VTRRSSAARIWRGLVASIVASCVCACTPTPADAALQACRDAVAQKSDVPIHIERKAIQIGALDPDSNTLQVTGPLRFVGADGQAHIETLDCRVRVAGGSADVIHLQLSWSLQELERSVRESR